MTVGEFINKLRSAVNAEGHSCNNVTILDVDTSADHNDNPFFAIRFVANNDTDWDNPMTVYVEEENALQ